MCIFLVNLLQSFNPRICKRCDRYSLYQILVYWVSIHASVKDATLSYMEQDRHGSVSIHASVKDATSKQQTVNESVGFNPRICKRCDSLAGTGDGVGTGFNPRICKRCDTFALGDGLADLDWFQSTHL